MRVSKSAVDAPRGGGFRLNGKPIAAIADGSIEEQVRKVAVKLPDDELLDTEEMAARIGHSRAGLANYVSKIQLKDVSAKVRVSVKPIRVFGNPKTIAKLLAGLERA